MAKGKEVVQGGAEGKLSGLLVRTHGQYYFKTDTAKGVKSFSREVKAPSLEFFKETVKKYIGSEIDPRTQLSVPKYKDQSFINIRGQLKKRLLPVLLAREYLDFARIRFVSIDEIISLDGQKLDLPISLRSREQLQELIEDEKMPLNSADYIDIDELRNDIYEYLESPDTFMSGKSLRDKRRAEEKIFREMNGLSDITLAPRKVEREKKVAVGIADL